MTRDSRRLLLLAGVLGLSLLSCGREVTGPGDGLSFGRNRTAALAIDPQFPQLPAGNFASDLVPFVKVRVTIRDLNGAMVRDTTVDFPSAADSIALSITVPLPSSTPAAGLPLTLTMVFVNAAGDTVFRGGPSAITAKPLGAPGASEPIVIPVTWVPPGAVPASVVLTPTTGSVTSGTTTVFRATAFDAVGDSIPNTPIVFAIDTATRATLVVLGGTSTATWLPNPGTVRIIASTLNVRADTSFFVVSLPVPTQLVITAAPTTAVAGTTLSAITVAVRDASNAPTPLFTGSVTLALNAGAIGATLAGTTTVTAVAGIATFSGLSIQRAATGLTLTASSGALTPATSSALAITPAAPAALVALAGDAQSGTLGQPLTDSLDVQLRDAFANPIVGSAIAFSVTTGGGSVSPTSVVTNANGRARARWTLGTAVGVQTARAQLAGVPAVFAAFGATGVPGAPVRLEIVTEPAATQIAGAAIAPAIGVRAVDAVGATVTSFTGTVTLALAANAGATTPTGVLATAAVAGIASFTSIAVTAAGAGYTLAATSGALVPDTTIAFTVLNAAAAQLSTVSGGAQSGTVGATIAAPFVVRVVDGFGNSVPNYAVNWAITGGSGTLTAAATLTNASGNASTTLTLPSLAGLVTVQATAVGVAGSPQSFSATATPGAAAALVLLTVVGPQVAGVPLMGVVVEVRDAVGNVATGFNGVVSGRVFTGPNGPDPDSLPVTAVAGVATFNGGIFDAAGVYTLQFFSVGLPDVFSSSFTVTAAAATQLGLASGAGQTGIAGQPLPLPFAVRIEDPFFNRIPGVTVTWVMVRGVDTLAVNTNVSDANGIAAWQPTLPTSVGPVQLTARSTGLTNSPITLAASVLGDVTTQLTMFTQPVGAVAGVALTANAVRARDQYGNFKTVFNGNVTAAIDSGPAGAVLAGTTTVPAVGGTATFGTLALNLAGSYRLRYSSGGLTSAVSTAFVVTAAIPTRKNT